MGRKVDVDELVGASEIAERLAEAGYQGLGHKRLPQVIHTWRQRYDDFPDPVAQLSSGLLWLYPEVEAWAKQREERMRSRPKRPRSYRPEDLVGAAEIAERLGASRPQAVHTWRQRDPAFPEPVAEVSHTLVWSWPDVKRWATETGRLSAG